MIAVVGLGRVGLVTAVRLAASGKRVLGVERDAAAREKIAVGRAPFPESGLAAALLRATRSGRLRTTGRLADVELARVVVICVDTPSVRAVLRELARLPGASRRRLVVRCTMPPGTLRALAKGFPAGVRAGLVLWPEFTREGTALADAKGGRLVLGALTPSAARAAAAALGLPVRGARLVSWETAELAKSSDNAFHALKAAFANEIGALARAFGADGAEALSILRADLRLNASAAYLFPGDAFGGPCLEKDARALARSARAAGTAAELVEGALRSNASRVADLVRRTPGRRVAVLGLEFKRGTGDLRGSVALAVAAALARRGTVVSLCASVRPRRGFRIVSTPELAVRGAHTVVLGPGAGPRDRRAARGHRVTVVR